MSNARSLLAGRPDMTPARAERLLSEHWGLVAQVRPLSSERDLNFAVAVGGVDRYVLKVANGLDPRSAVDLQQEMMMRLLDRGLPVPDVVPTGGSSTVCCGDHPVWLIGLLPGSPMAYSEPTDETFVQLGRLIGRVSLALDGFDHPGARRSMQWDVQRADDVIAHYRPYVRDSTRGALLDRELTHLQRRVLPVLDHLPRTVVHNDANDHNVLVDERGDITGLIDFGDALHSVRIHDLAVACAYAMLDRDDPTTVAERIIAAYEAEFAATDVELTAVPHLIRARLATSVAISAYQSRDVDDPYLRVSEEAAWTLLERWEGGAPWPTS